MNILIKTHLPLLLYPLLGTILLLSACEQTAIEPPPNPFDDIVYPEPPSPLPEPDSASIVGLHKYIFSKSCAVPGCHDGAFEPDFRTVQSTYSTLVFQPVIKNTVGGEYEYRVLPYDTDASWLYNRVTTEDQILGRMPLYDVPLNEGQLKSIRDWINQGAQDMFGNVSNQPNRQPGFTGLAAFLDYNGFEVRVDTIRGNQAYFPFAALPNSELRIWFALEDDSTALGQLQDSYVAFTDEIDGYDQGLQVQAVYNASPKLVPDYYGPNQDGIFYWSVTINSSNVPAAPLEAGGPEISFFRLHTDDGDHEEAFIFPREQHPFEFKLYMSFFLVP